MQERLIFFYEPYFTQNFNIYKTANKVKSDQSYERVIQY